MFEVTGYLKLD